jgi:hypothetical protein
VHDHDAAVCRGQLLEESPEWGSGVVAEGVEERLQVDRPGYAIGFSGSGGGIS